MKKKKPVNKSQIKKAVQQSLQNFQNRFNQTSGTSANAYVGKTVSENKSATRRVRKVQNPK
jgi:hypothetical protein